MNDGEKLAESFLTGHGFDVERYHRNRDPVSNRLLSAPDFQVTMPKSGLFFFCEVKSIASKEGKGIRHSTVTNIFETKIYEAVDQFRAVNLLHMVPNVLILQTDEFRISWHSFKQFLSGYVSIPSHDGRELVVTETRRISQSRLGDRMEDIDLFIILQGAHGDFFFGGQYSPFAHKLARGFNIEYREIMSAPVR